MIVYGTGSLDVPTNRANISFTVKGFASSIQAAVDTARRKVNDILARLITIGLQDKNFYTSSFNSGDNFEGKAFLSSRRDFRTQIDVYVTVDSLALLEGVVTILANSPVDKLSNISFSLRSDSSVKLEARRLAVANAQEKAALMARQLGVILGKALNVEELLSYSDGDFYFPPRDRGVLKLEMGTISESGGSQQYTAFYGQRSSVRAGVRIVFEIVGSK